MGITGLKAILDRLPPGWELGLSPRFRDKKRVGYRVELFRHGTMVGYIDHDESLPDALDDLDTLVTQELSGVN